ncbi:DoxX family protein [Candidatus Woesearchaeota archaeon]|nr:DoxX family protein [Candidatus Woesearchaeota archaeon]
MSLKNLNKYNDWAPLLLRLALGAVFIVHGAQKLFGGITGTTGFFDSVGIPLAGVFAVVVALVEFLGGIALVLGVLTRYASLLLAINMLVALLVVHLKNGFFVSNSGFEFVLVLLAGSLALLIRGPGKIAIQKE